MKGVLDRFEGNQAVILIEESREEIVVPKEELPIGSKVNTYFKLKKTNHTIKITTIDHKTTVKQNQKSSKLMAKLRAKSKGSNYKK